jgi:acyl-homoserine lactone acylase PvdQ
VDSCGLRDLRHCPGARLAIRRSQVTIKESEGADFYYRYGNDDRPVTKSTVVVPYKSGTSTARRLFTVYRTHHGPVVREAGSKWVTVKLLQEPVKAFTQSHLTAFADLIPALVKGYDELPAGHPLRAKVAEQIEVLRKWDFRWSLSSVATSLAVFWGEELWRRIRADAGSEDLPIYEYMAKRTPGEKRLEAPAAASARLQADFGNWKTPGERSTGSSDSPATSSSLSTTAARAFPSRSRPQDGDRWVISRKSTPGWT